MVGFDQKNHHHCFDVWEHALHAMAALPEDAVLRCAMLMHDIGKPACFTVDEQGTGHFYGHGAISCEMADRMLRRLKYSNELRQNIVILVEWHDREIQRTEKAMRRALRKLGEKTLRQLIHIKRADNLAQAPEYHHRQAEIDLAGEILDRLIAEDACFSLRQLAVNGRDMMQLGLRGTEIGAALDALLDGVVNGDLPNEREVLLKAVTLNSQICGETEK